MVMKLEMFKRLFHPVWDNPADDVDVQFLAPGMGGKWALEVKETHYDVANKLWTVEMDIKGPTAAAAEHNQSLHSHGQAAGQHTHESDEAAAPQPDGVPVADEPSDD